MLCYSIHRTELVSAHTLQTNENHQARAAILVINMSPIRILRNSLVEVCIRCLRLLFIARVITTARDHR